MKDAYFAALKTGTLQPSFTTPDAEKPPPSGTTEPKNEGNTQIEAKEKAGKKKEPKFKLKKKGEDDPFASDEEGGQQPKPQAAKPASKASKPLSKAAKPASSAGKPASRASRRTRANAGEEDVAEVLAEEEKEEERKEVFEAMLGEKRGLGDDEEDGEDEKDEKGPKRRKAAD
jgi:hypothetical protein